jgi:hypothetical protein
MVSAVDTFISYINLFGEEEFYNTTTISILELTPMKINRVPV